MQQPTYYSNGLRFTCTRCSICCRHEPGYVFLTKNDLKLLVSELKIEYTEFVNTYCRWISGLGGRISRLSLKEKPNYDCIFWENGCKYYSARPLQCRAFPFWYSILQSKNAWDEAARSCPGMGNGTLHNAEYIEDWLRQQHAQSMVLKTDPIPGELSCEFDFGASVDPFLPPSCPDK